MNFWLPKVGRKSLKRHLNGEYIFPKECKMDPWTVPCHAVEASVIHLYFVITNKIPYFCAHKPWAYLSSQGFFDGLICGRTYPQGGLYVGKK